MYFLNIKTNRRYNFKENYEYDEPPPRSPSLQGEK